MRSSNPKDLSQAAGLPARLDRGIRPLSRLSRAGDGDGDHLERLLFMGWFGFSQFLFAVNLIAFPILFAAILARLLRHTAALWKDLLDPRTVFSFFTIVAACDVLGIQFDLAVMPGRRSRSGCSRWSPGSSCSISASRCCPS